MKDATIDDVEGLLAYIEAHIDLAREVVVMRDHARALAQLEEIEGWASAAVEALKADPLWPLSGDHRVALVELAEGAEVAAGSHEALVESTANVLRLRDLVAQASSDGFNLRVVLWARSRGLDLHLLVIGPRESTTHIDGTPWTVLFMAWIQNRWREWASELGFNGNHRAALAAGRSHAEFDAWLAEKGTDRSNSA